VESDNNGDIIFRPGQDDESLNLLLQKSKEQVIFILSQLGFVLHNTKTSFEMRLQKTGTITEVNEILKQTLRKFDRINKSKLIKNRGLNSGDMFKPCSFVTN
jgi:hypothetical protein